MGGRRRTREERGRLRDVVYDRIRLAWRAFGWRLIGALGAGAILLAFAGFARAPDPPPILDRVYATLQLFVFEYNGPASPGWELQTARFLAPAAAGFAAIRAVLLVFGEQLLRLRMRRGHVVICGFGEKGRAFAASLRAAGYRVVVIDPTPTDDAVALGRDLGAPVLAGDARHPSLLRKARARKAGHVVAVCGDDGVNAEIAVTAQRLAEAAGNGTVCHAHIVDPVLCTQLVAHAIIVESPGRARFEFFNLYQASALALLDHHPPVTGDDESSHVVIVGDGRLAEALLCALVRRTDGNEPLRVDRIGVVAAGASALVRRLTDTYGEPPPVEVVARDLPVGSRHGSLTNATRQLGASSPVTCAYVCIEEDSRAVQAAFELETGLPGVPIVTRMKNTTGLARLLETRGPAGVGGPVTVFAMDQVCTPDLLFGGPLELIARQLHQEYVAEKRAHDASTSRDPSTDPWSDLNEGLRRSNRHQAAHLGAKLRAVGCALAPSRSWRGGSYRFDNAEVELLARLEHDRWMEERRAEGWRRGPHRDPANRRTPYLVPWEALSEDVRDLDRLFIRGLPTFLGRIGFDIVPLSTSPTPAPFDATTRSETHG